MATSKFIIIRKDLDTDPTIVESEGLTIGREVSNDLTLNHPTVSRTHAGITEVGSDFWISNLSNANGTILNGSLVDSAPMASGDILQIGPFSMHVSVNQEGLTLTVEMSVNPLRTENAGATQLLTMPDTSGKTQMLNPALMQAQMQKPSAGGTQRLSMTGKLTGLLAQPQEFALKVFWDKRKRDAGKLAERTPLRPNLTKGVGKARFNWRPTSDLRRPWPAGLFVWAAVIIAVAAVASAFAFKNAYSPGPISTPHTREALALNDPNMAIAKRPNANSCTECHAISLTATMQSQCIECHTTPGFKSTVSSEHEALEMQCYECHGQEHQGDVFNLVVAKQSCTECHRAGYVYTNPSLDRSITLSTPHGGESVGYPVENGVWTWKGWSEERWQERNLPETAGAFDSKAQFHLVHTINGLPYQRVECSDCHVAGFDAANLTKGVKESCATCHSPNAGRTAAEGNTAVPVIECTSCHQQHLEGKDPLAIVRTRQISAERQK